MGFYAKYVFPHLVDHLLSRPQTMRTRKEALAHATGEVLEIGFGTGLNLECYPECINRVTAIDPSEPMMKKAYPRIRKSRISVDHHAFSAEALPYPSERFDAVVSTWTLCSIPEIEQALGEIRRVLKEDGRFVSWSTVEALTNQFNNGKRDSGLSSDSLAGAVIQTETSGR